MRVLAPNGNNLVKLGLRKTNIFGTHKLPKLVSRIVIIMPIVRGVWGGDVDETYLS